MMNLLLCNESIDCNVNEILESLENDLFDDCC